MSRSITSRSLPIRWVEFIRRMEVLLNTIWLLLAVGAFLYWHPDKYRETSAAHGHNRAYGILVLACALILLFPSSVPMFTGNYR